MSANSAIEVKGLDKVYRGSGNTKPMHALKKVDMQIPRGSIFGLLGPNGAGKSTFINILAGLVLKTSGHVNIWGFDIDENPRNARASIGVVPQELMLDAFFTPREVLELQAGLYGVPKDQRLTEDILKMIQLDTKADAYARTLSGGMKRRLMVGKAMVHSPPILVLDEPTAGVDIELRQQLWENVRALNSKGVTIVLTTHYLEEAEELCDHIAIMNHGELIACEEKKTLLNRIDEKELIFEIEQTITEIPKAFNGFNTRLTDDNRIAFQISRADNNIQQILDLVRNQKLTVVDIATSETDLEDIFLQLTKR